MNSETEFIRKDFPQGYYTLTWRDSDLRESPWVNLYDPDGKPLNVLFTNAYFNDECIVEGLQRKITAMEDHLEDLKKALSVLSKGV